MLKGNVSVAHDRSAYVRKSLSIAASKAVRKVCFDTEAMAKGACPVDTGAAKASIYSNVGDHNGYSESANHLPKGDKMLPEEKPEHDLQGVVAVGVEYGFYIDQGTRWVPARPFFTRAVDTMSKVFDKVTAQLLKAELK